MSCLFCLLWSSWCCLFRFSNNLWVPPGTGLFLLRSLNLRSARIQSIDQVGDSHGIWTNLGVSERQGVNTYAIRTFYDFFLFWECSDYFRNEELLMEVAGLHDKICYMWYNLWHEKPQCQFPASCFKAGDFLLALQQGFPVSLCFFLWLFTYIRELTSARTDHWTPSWKKKTWKNFYYRSVGQYLN